MSNIDKEYPLVLQLILAQLVIEQGTDAFRSIAESLERHPMLQNIPERKMTATKCRSLYLEMIKKEGLELNSGDTGVNSSRDSEGSSINKESGVSHSPSPSLSSSSTTPSSSSAAATATATATATAKKKKMVTPELRLAQILYMSYTEELIQDMHQDETEFVTTYRELEDLQRQAEALKGTE